VSGVTLRPDPGDLARLTALDGADGALLARAASMMRLSSAAPGQVIGREGDPGEEFWLVLEGEVEITRDNRTGPRVLGVAPAGSILGELAVLLGRPRTATVTAVSPSRLATGGAEVLDLLAGDPTVRARLRSLATSRLAQNLRPVRATLADGTPIVVRPLLPEDRQVFGDEVHRLSVDSRRRRFFSASGPSEALIDYLTDIDYVEHFAWVAIDVSGAGEGLATARYVRTGPEPVAEMAFGTADRHQRRGLGTFLLGAVGVAAVEAGIERLVAHVLEDNLAMRAVFAKAAATSRFDEPGVVFVEVDPAAAAALLLPDTRQALALAVHDIVTAASLALTHPDAAHGPPDSPPVAP
jgi:CRP-like cAMP-binding protein